MTDSTVGVRQAADADKLIDNEELVTAGGTVVQRQRVQIGGHEAARLAEVTDDAPADDAYGLAIRPARTLTERLNARAPAPGYRLWIDTADTNHIYLLEAPAGSTDIDTGFRGVRLPLDLLGNIVGQVEENTGATLTFANRTTDGSWT